MKRKKYLELIFDSDFWKSSWVVPSFVITIATIILTFFDLTEYKTKLFIGIVIFTFLFILIKLILKSRLNKIILNIDGSQIEISTGDIFEYPEDVFKVIAFNEYYDTQVDDEIISRSSLNGKYINRFYNSITDLEDLNNRILTDTRLLNKIKSKDVERKLGGKTIKYELGSVFKDKDFFLVAFSKFNDNNQANLKLSEYANCLITFWNEINSLYSQKTVVVPLLGSGITRHRDFNATSQELLEVMLWTFKISKVKFREPSKIIIVMLEKQQKEINFYKLKVFEKSRL